MEDEITVVVLDENKTFGEVVMEILKEVNDELVVTEWD
jgi:hypothetical protein